MKREDFNKEIEQLKENIGIWQIVMDELCLTDFVLGIYWDKDDEVWKVYINYERGRHRVRLKTKSEDDALEKLHNMIKSIADTHIYCKIK